MAKKCYVVWKGHKPGVYSSWEECKAQIFNFPSAKYKSFEDEELAHVAFKRGYEGYVKPSGGVRKLSSLQELVEIQPNLETIAVDAACSGNPGLMEYRGVYTRTGEEMFRVGPLEEGTNNVGEFLAIVHGLAWLKQKDSKMPIYSDSVNAMLWVKQGKCRTKLARTQKNTKIFELIARAETWLQNNFYANDIYKWETKSWGEIPADFGRKRK